MHLLYILSRHRRIWITSKSKYKINLPIRQYLPMQGRGGLFVKCMVCIGLGPAEEGGGWEECRLAPDATLFDYLEYNMIKLLKLHFIFSHKSTHIFGPDPVSVLKKNYVVFKLQKQLFMCPGSSCILKYYILLI